MSKLRIAALCVSLLSSLTAHAEVIRFDVLQFGPAFEARSFGNVGPYVKITARATIAVDPADPRNAIIADIDKAPRDERAWSKRRPMSCCCARPLRGNGTLLADIANRSTKLAPELFDDALRPGSNDAEKSADAGIGFLLGPLSDATINDGGYGSPLSRGRRGLWGILLNRTLLPSACRVAI
jgi:hypothetical protein